APADGFLMNVKADVLHTVHGVLLWVRLGAGPLVRALP
ncbi:MAG: hypothetical protein QOJ99_488, partial [Bryobacterales bacterium]|nr:hypothetical protein [Bryobacterales bacterium]